MLKDDTKNNIETVNTDITATYSAEDNKLRLYASQRFDDEILQMVKKAGFKWAPKQELFVAPKWTPSREDLCFELAGEIEPEGTTLVERAEAKAERLDAIAQNKERKANAYYNVASELSRAFEFGQPILVGHHSERKSRKTKERMNSAQSKAAENFNAISYWQYRAEGVERHANYKNNPAVRARRIKKLLAELRDIQRDINHAAICLKYWTEAKTDDKVRALSNRVLNSGAVTPWNFQDAFHQNELTPQELREKCIKNSNLIIASPNRSRWINHILGRLGFEREMLGEVAQFEGVITPVILQTFAREHGAHSPKSKKLDNDQFELVSIAPLPLHIADGNSLDLTAEAWRDLMQSVGYEVPNKKPTKAPILNFKADILSSENLYHRGQVDTFNQLEMTKADFAKTREESRGTRLSVCGTFRFKTCLDPFFEGARFSAPRVAVFLTDSKIHLLPATAEAN